MIATYAKHDIHFSYPENWTLGENQQEDSLDITVQSPAGAVWSLTIYDGTHFPDHVAKQTLEALRGEYPELESAAADEVVEGFPQTGYDVNFFLLDFLVTCSIRAFRANSRTFCIFREAESRDFDELSEVYRAVTFSLLKSLEMGKST